MTKHIFTKKHYEVIAETIKQVKAKTHKLEDSEYRRGVDYMVSHLIVMFETDNSNFNKDKFINAIK